MKVPRTRQRLKLLIRWYRLNSRIASRYFCFSYRVENTKPSGSGSPEFSRTTLCLSLQAKPKSYTMSIFTSLSSQSPNWNLVHQNCRKSRLWKGFRRLVLGNCERSPPGLSQLKCWPDEQRTPFRDRDHSENEPQWVPGFLSYCSGMFQERFRSKSVLADSEENRRVLTKHPKYVTPSDWILWEAFYWPSLQFHQKPWKCTLEPFPDQVCFATDCSLYLHVFLCKLPLHFSYSSMLPWFWRKSSVNCADWIDF